MKVFTIFDSKVGCYFPPFMMRSVGEAERAVGSHANDPLHNFYKYAEDFTLFEIGSWDERTGKYSLLDAPHSIGNLVQFKKMNSLPGAGA